MDNDITNPINNATHDPKHNITPLSMSVVDSIPETVIETKQTSKVTAPLFLVPYVYLNESIYQTLISNCNLSS